VVIVRQLQDLVVIKSDPAELHFICEYNIVKDDTYEVGASWNELERAGGGVQSALQHCSQRGATN
jgi:hypothetical protein